MLPSARSQLIPVTVPPQDCPPRCSALIPFLSIPQSPELEPAMPQTSSEFIHTLFPWVILPEFCLEYSLPAVRSSICRAFADPSAAVWLPDLAEYKPSHVHSVLGSLVVWVLNGVLDSLCSPSPQNCMRGSAALILGGPVFSYHSFSNPRFQ